MKRLFALFTLGSYLIQSALIGVTVGTLVAIVSGNPAAGFYTFVILTAIQLVLPSAPAGSLYMAFTQGICEKVQTSLIDVLGDKAPQNKRTQVGYLQALMSPTNMAGVNVIPIDPGTGKKKSVRIVAIKRGLEDDVITTKIDDCSTSIEPAPYEDTVEITSYIGSPGIKFSETEMRKLCKADSAYMAEVIQSQIDPVVAALNRRLIVGQSTNFGNFADGSNTVHDVALLQDNATKTPIFYGESSVMEELDAIYAEGRPLVIGAGDLVHYARMTDMGCCNIDGLDISQAGQWEVYRDRMVTSEIGPEHFIVLAPGYTQLLTYNEYVGTYAKENDVFSHGTIVDPYSGLKLDQRWHYNDCDDTYSLNFGVWYKQYRIPATAFASADPLFGVNYSLHFRAVRATY